MNGIFSLVTDIFVSNGLVMSFLLVAVVYWVAKLISEKATNNRIHASAIAIVIALVVAYVGGKISGGSKGIADLSLFTGLGILGGASMRDFTIISTGFGAKLSELKKCGFAGILSVILGVISAYVVGVVVALCFGYTDAPSVATIAAGAVTFVVGPVTGAAVGADSAVIALSIAAGAVKSIGVMILTPLFAKRIGLCTPQAAMIYGGLMGTTSGTSAGLAATNVKLVPYGAMTATFYTGCGCLLCPTVLYALTCLVLPA